jgi:hypothetical protein
MWHFHLKRKMYIVRIAHIIKWIHNIVWIEMNKQYNTEIFTLLMSEKCVV